jgi:hypothetical protein
MTCNLDGFVVSVRIFSFHSGSMRGTKPKLEEARLLPDFIKREYCLFGIDGERVSVSNQK